MPCVYILDIIIISDSSETVYSFPQRSNLSRSRPTASSDDDALPLSGLNASNNIRQQAIPGPRRTTVCLHPLSFVRVILFTACPIWIEDEPRATGRSRPLINKLFPFHQISQFILHYAQDSGDVINPGTIDAYAPRTGKAGRVCDCGIYPCTDVFLIDLIAGEDTGDPPGFLCSG